MHPTTVTVFNCKFIGSSAETGGGGYTMGGEGNIILVETCMFEGKRIIHCWWSYCHCNLFFISIQRSPSTASDYQLVGRKNSCVLFACLFVCFSSFTRNKCVDGIVILVML